MARKRIYPNKAVITERNDYFAGQDKLYYSEGFNRLEHHWKKCIKLIWIIKCIYPERIKYSSMLPECTRNKQLLNCIGEMAGWKEILFKQGWNHRDECQFCWIGPNQFDRVQQTGTSLEEMAKTTLEKKLGYLSVFWKCITVKLLLNRLNIDGTNFFDVFLFSPDLARLNYYLYPNMEKLLRTTLKNKNEESRKIKYLRLLQKCTRVKLLLNRLRITGLSLFSPDLAPLDQSYY